MSKWYRSNQAIGIYIAVLIALLLIYIFTTPWVFREARDGFYLGFFPLLGAVAMMLCALAMIIDPLRREVPEDVEEFGWRDAGSAILLLVGVGIYFSVMREIGFLIVTPIFLFIYMFWFGVRPLRQTIILAVTIPLGIYILFSVIGVRLPNGILPAFI